MSEQSNNKATNKSYQLVLVMISLISLFSFICIFVINGGKDLPVILMVILTIVFVAMQIALVGIRNGISEISMFNSSGNNFSPSESAVFIFFCVPILFFYIIFRVLRLFYLALIAHVQIIKENKKIGIIALLVALLPTIAIIATVFASNGFAFLQSSDATTTAIQEKLVACDEHIEFTLEIVATIQKAEGKDIDRSNAKNTDYFRKLIAQRLTELLKADDYEGVLKLVAYLLDQDIYLLDTSKGAFLDIVFMPEDVASLATYIQQHGELKYGRFSYEIDGISCYLSTNNNHIDVNFSQESTYIVIADYWEHWEFPGSRATIVGDAPIFKRNITK